MRPHQFGALGLAVFVASCGIGCASPTSPTPSRYLLFGTITDGTTALAGAEVKITPAGCNAFTLLTQLTGAEGHYEARVPTECGVTIEIRKNGFVPQSHMINVLHERYQADFALQPLAGTDATGNINGDYQLTITASPRCTLPAEVMQRTYAAHLEETRPGIVAVTLSGADFVQFGAGTRAGFEGTRDGASLHLIVDNGYGGDFYFIENVDGTRSLSFEGEANLVIFENRIAGTFSAEIGYYVSGSGQSGWVGRCIANDHFMNFSR